MPWNPKSSSQLLTLWAYISPMGQGSVRAHTHKLANMSTAHTLLGASPVLSPWLSHQCYLSPWGGRTIPNGGCGFPFPRGLLIHHLSSGAGLARSLLKKLPPLAQVCTFSEIHRLREFPRALTVYCLCSQNVSEAAALPCRTSGVSGFLSTHCDPTTSQF